METIYDVLYYLNKLDFTDNKNDTDFENLRSVKRILVKEFEDCNMPKLYDVLSIVDILFITLTVGELQDILNKTDTLRIKILNLIRFKHFVNKNEEICNQNYSSKCFIFNEINKLTIKIYSNLANKNTHFYLVHRIPIIHRYLFRELSQNHE